MKRTVEVKTEFVSAETKAVFISPEEAERRIAEYRRFGLVLQAPPQVVYLPAQHPCPWPQCGYRVVAINFQLAMLGTETDLGHWTKAWWQGPGLVARCPGCRRHVLFTMQDKRVIPETEPFASIVLPDDWYERAHVVSRD
jgi:hypothetical protein